MLIIVFSKTLNWELGGDSFLAISKTNRSKELSDTRICNGKSFNKLVSAKKSNLSYCYFMIFTSLRPDSVSWIRENVYNFHNH